MSKTKKRTQPYRILVVDNEPEVVRLLVRHLEAAGFLTGNESNGAFALKLMRQEKFDLAVTDFAMPEMDGTELTRAIRRDPQLKTIPIILMAARPPDGAVEQFEAKRLECWECDPDLIMTMPFHFDELMKGVQKLLPQREEIRRGPTQRQRRILVVDDQPRIVRLVVRHLEAAGYATGNENNGVPALKRLRQERFDAVVTDLVMPEMHGGELIRQIRRDETLCDTPIILMSGHPCDISWAEFLAPYLPDAKADLYLTKPFNPQEVINFVERLLAREAT